MSSKDKKLEMSLAWKGVPFRLTLDGPPIEALAHISDFLACMPQVKELAPAGGGPGIMGVLVAVMRTSRPGEAWAIFEPIMRAYGFIAVRIAEFYAGDEKRGAMMFQYDNSGGFGDHYSREGYRLTDQLWDYLRTHCPTWQTWPMMSGQLTPENRRLKTDAQEFGLHEFLGVSEFVHQSRICGASLGGGRGVLSGLPEEDLLALVLLTRVVMLQEYRLTFAGIPNPLDLLDRETEYDIAKLLAGDVKQEALAERLGVSVSTIEKRVKKIKQKLGLGNVSRSAFINKLKHLFNL